LGFRIGVFNKLPMEFAIEANALLAVSLEGAVG
jgi:Fe-S cluster assembly scaffold protein SufB